MFILFPVIYSYCMHAIFTIISSVLIHCASFMLKFKIGGQIYCFGKRSFLAESMPSVLLHHHLLKRLVAGLQILLIALLIDVDLITFTTD